MYSPMTAVMCLVLTIAIVVVFFQVRNLVKTTRQRRQEKLASLAAPPTEPKQSIVETSIAAGNRVKDAKRRARQRKATRRTK